MTKGTQDVWLRLARLEAICTIDLNYVHSDNGDVCWRMTIARRDGSAPAIVVEREKAVDAVFAALAAIEGRAPHA